ncbi:hypothetical protein I312_105255 [Cryptococcus bacillisporus CA1280]|uniref:uncharacterized protein n=1 Tax=Cryptococcus bacillisporus CA1280 TaxID=1296109 RepID=UPI003365DB8F
MPIATKTYPITPFDRPAPTTEDLHWADLTELPLDLFYYAKGRTQLVERIKHALEVDDLGFWSVTNAGFSDEEIDHQFAISQAFFNLPIEEKKSNAIDAKNGGYLSYRAPYERTIADTDVLDNMELINIPKYTDDYKDYPRHDIFKAHEAVIAEFHRKCWHQIARPLFRDMQYHPRTPDDDVKCNNLWSWAHTDYGSLTLLFSQTVSGLQAKFSDGSYRDIKYKKGSVVVNIADTLSFMTKGYLRSTIHRVTVPPGIQSSIHRIGVLHGCRPNDNVPVMTAPSPFLERLGLISDADRNAKEKDAVTAGEYVAARVKAVHGSRDLRCKTAFKYGS